MADIIAFPASAALSRPARGLAAHPEAARHAQAQILFFTGVRIERHEGEAPVARPVSKRRGTAVNGPSRRRRS